jgi:hypothetical protein
MIQGKLLKSSLAMRALSRREHRRNTIDREVRQWTEFVQKSNVQSNTTTAFSALARPLQRAFYSVRT